MMERSALSGRYSAMVKMDTLLVCADPSPISKIFWLKTCLETLSEWIEKVLIPLQLKMCLLLTVISCTSNSGQSRT